MTFVALLAWLAKYVLEFLYDKAVSEWVVVKAEGAKLDADFDAR